MQHLHVLSIKNPSFNLEDNIIKPHTLSIYLSPLHLAWQWLLPCLEESKTCQRQMASGENLDSLTESVSEKTKKAQFARQWLLIGFLQRDKAC